MTHFRLQVGLCHKYIASLLLKIFIIRYFFYFAVAHGFPFSTNYKTPCLFINHTSKYPGVTQISMVYVIFYTKYSNVVNKTTGSQWKLAQIVQSQDTLRTWVLTCKQWPLLTINDIHICVCNPFLQYSLI